MKGTNISIDAEDNLINSEKTTLNNVQRITDKNQKVLLNPENIQVENTTNYFASTIKSNYKLIATQNILRKSRKFSCRIALNILILNILYLFF